MLSQAESIALKKSYCTLCILAKIKISFLPSFIPSISVVLVVRLNNIMSPDPYSCHILLTGDGTTTTGHPVHLF